MSLVGFTLMDLRLLVKTIRARLRRYTLRSQEFCSQGFVFAYQNITLSHRNLFLIIPPSPPTVVLISSLSFFVAGFVSFCCCCYNNSWSQKSLMTCFEFTRDLPIEPYLPIPALYWLDYLSPLSLIPPAT